MKNRVIFVFPALVLMAVFGTGGVFGQQDKLVDSLTKNRTQLVLKDGKFAGTAAPLLEKALAESQFVLIGEEHGTQQVPAFASAVCNVVGPLGFHTMAVEAGPRAAAAIQPWIGGANSREQLAQFEKKFPDTIAFFNLQPELELLSHCAAVAQGGTFQVWGLDQEFMGSSGYLLSRILETHPGKQATAETERLLAKNDEARASAAKSGNPGELFMMSVSDADLAGLRALLQKEGDTTAQALLDELMESREIYYKNATAGAESNRQRALLMKRNFVRNYQATARAEGAVPKILMKFGDWHLYKGFNPLLNNDIGNTLAELGDGMGMKSLHIAILAVKGTRLRFAGIGRPYQPETFQMLDDKDYKFLQPMVDDLEAGGWTMFDLRGIRKAAFQGLLDRDMERLVLGYDLLILIPDSTASTQIR
ncbi:MAG: hypothetical protein WBW33_34495 [Bryobacteraceae bacterium]